MKDRVYICHTFYHVYISVLKELAMPSTMRGKATLILSTMSNDFGTMTERARACGLFEEVLLFDEKEDITDKTVMKYHADQSNIVLNFLQRIIYTKLLGKLQEKYIPTDLKQFRDVYVYCDSDPIGYYLNYKRIKYHAIEDGLDTLKYCDDARYSNRGHFELKVKMAAMNLIFIENGYSKYCIDMEVNDISCLKYKMDKYVEVPREELFKGLKPEDVHYLMEIFMEDSEALTAQIDSVDPGMKKVMILSDPVCDLNTRTKIVRDIIAEYGKDAVVFIKPHPRDILDYNTEAFSDCIVLKGRFPMEMINFLPKLHMNRVVSIFTVIDSIKFADEVILLGPDFMDKYEEPSIHRQNEVI